MSVYKKENPEYFSLALKSNLEDQTLLPTEMVLVCDGPLTEELDAVIQQYSEKHPDVLNVYRLAENGGLGKALNFGLEKCQYEWVARSDSDDVCDCRRFEIQADYLTNHPDVDALGSWIDEFDTDWKEPSRTKTMPLSCEAIAKMAKTRNPINHMTAMFRKSVVLGIGSYWHLPYMEDYFLWVRLLCAGAKLENLDRVLVHARVGNGMAARRGNRAQISSRRELNRYMVQHGMLSRVEAAVNMVLIVGFTCCPNWVRKFVYDKVLRR